MTSGVGGTLAATIRTCGRAGLDLPVLVRVGDGPMTDDRTDMSRELPMSVAPPLDRLGVQLHPEDNVLVATRDLHDGDSAGALVVRATVPRGHKVAVAPIAEGDPV